MRGVRVGFARIGLDAAGTYGIPADTDTPSADSGSSRVLQSREATDTSLKALLDRGIPTFAASGDDGARDNDPNHNMGRNADYPAASPYSFGERPDGHR